MAKVRETSLYASAEEELELLQERIDTLKEEIDSMEKYKTYRKTADELYMMKKSFEDAGFTNEEAMELFKMVAVGSMLPKF